MSDLEAEKVSRRRLIPWVVMILVMALLVGIAWFSMASFESAYGTDLSLAHPLVSLRMFSAEGVTEEAAQQPTEIDVGVEGNLDLAGFINVDPTCHCPASFWEELMQSPEKLAASLGKGVSVRYLFRYDNQMAYQYFQDSSSFAGLASLNIVPASAPRKASFYAPDANADIWRDKSVANSSLAAALTVLDPNTPTVLLTDFVEPQGELDGQQLRKACEKLFDQNLTLAVVCMESTFGGLLTDVGEAGKVYAYGRTSLKHDSRLDGSDQSAYHLQPRYFYAVVVGSAQQCEEIIEGRKAADGGATVGLSDLYRNFVATLDFKSPNPCNHTHHPYDAPQVLYFGRSGVLSVRNSVDQQTIIATKLTQDDADQATRTASQMGLNRAPMHAEGVDAYRIVKDDSVEKQVMSIAYRVVPDVERYAETWQEDEYALGTVEKKQLEFTSLTREQATQQTNSVQIIGKFYASYDFVDFTGAETAFTVSKFTPSADGLSFQVDINAASLERGIYRLVIPITLVRNRNAAMPDLDTYAWISARSLSRYDMISKKGDLQRGSKTTDLREHLMQMNDALKILSQRAVPLANITIDLEIQ